MDFQLRPENEDHLWYALNVLDWPSVEDGQIQRKAGNGSTFADIAEENQAVSANADNGDMRLIPMLEIEMTGESFPLKFTTPEIDVKFSGALTATVHSNRMALTSPWISRWIPVTPSPGGHQQRSCQNLGNNLYTFTGVADGASRTISNQKLTGLADGKHGLKLTISGKDYCVDIGNVANGPFADQIVVRDPLDPYGISVREKDDDGTLLAYVPLNLVADRVRDRPHGLRWPYGLLAHDQPMGRHPEGQRRLGDPDAHGSPLHGTALRPRTRTGYWIRPRPCMYTGTSGTSRGWPCREDHGLDVVIIYEDPAQKTSAKARAYEDALWMLAWGLDSAFITGRDEDQDGQRDITIAEIYNRWGDPDTTASDTNELEHPGHGHRRGHFFLPAPGLCRPHRHDRDQKDPQ